MFSLLAVLSFDADRPQQAATFSVPAAVAYRLRSVRSSADSPYCVSVIENDTRARALSLACYEPGESAMVFSGTRVRAGGSYQVVVFRPTRDYAPAAVIVKLFLDKEKP